MSLIRRAFSQLTPCVPTSLRPPSVLGIYIGVSFGLLSVCARLHGEKDLLDQAAAFQQLLGEKDRLHGQLQCSFARPGETLVVLMSSSIHHKGPLIHVVCGGDGRERDNLGVLEGSSLLIAQQKRCGWTEGLHPFEPTDDQVIDRGCKLGSIEVREGDLPRFRGEGIVCYDIAAAHDPGHFRRQKLRVAI